MLNIIKCFLSKNYEQIIKSPKYFGTINLKPALECRIYWFP